MSEMSHNQSLEVVTPSLERAAIAKEGFQSASSPAGHPRPAGSSSQEPAFPKRSLSSPISPPDAKRRQSSGQLGTPKKLNSYYKVRSGTKVDRYIPESAPPSRHCAQPFTLTSPSRPNGDIPLLRRSSAYQLRNDPWNGSPSLTNDVRGGPPDNVESLLRTSHLHGSPEVQTKNAASLPIVDVPGAPKGPKNDRTQFRMLTANQKQRPFVFVPVTCLPIALTTVEHLVRFFRRLEFEPEVLVDPCGYYAMFPPTARGVRDAERCYTTFNGRKLFTMYTLELELVSMTSQSLREEGGTQNLMDTRVRQIPTSNGRPSDSLVVSGPGQSFDRETESNVYRRDSADANISPLAIPRGVNTHVDEHHYHRRSSTNDIDPHRPSSLTDTPVIRFPSPQQSLGNSADSKNKISDLSSKHKVGEDSMSVCGDEANTMSGSPNRIDQDCNGNNHGIHSSTDLLAVQHRQRADDEVSMSSVVASSDVSSSKIVEKHCWSCKKSTAPAFNPMVRCNTCRRQYHETCRNPSLRSGQDASIWQCAHCIKKQRPLTKTKPKPNTLSVNVQNPERVATPSNGNLDRVRAFQSNSQGWSSQLHLQHQVTCSNDDQHEATPQLQAVTQDRAVDLDHPQPAKKPQLLESVALDAGPREGLPASAITVPITPVQLNATVLEELSDGSMSIELIETGMGQHTSKISAGAASEEKERSKSPEIPDTPPAEQEQDQEFLRQTTPTTPLSKAVHDAFGVESIGSSAFLTESNEDVTNAAATKPKGKVKCMGCGKMFFSASGAETCRACAVRNAQNDTRQTTDKQVPETPDAREESTSILQDADLSLPDAASTPVQVPHENHRSNSFIFGHSLPRPPTVTRVVNKTGSPKKPARPQPLTSGQQNHQPAIANAIVRQSTTETSYVVTGAVTKPSPAESSAVKTKDAAVREASLPSVRDSVRDAELVRGTKEPTARMGDVVRLPEEICPETVGHEQQTKTRLSEAESSDSEDDVPLASRRYRAGGAARKNALPMLTHPVGEAGDTVINDDISDAGLLEPSSIIADSPKPNETMGPPLRRQRTRNASFSIAAESEPSGTPGRSIADSNYAGSDTTPARKWGVPPKKYPFSYQQVLGLALINFPQNSATLPAIVDWIAATFPRYYERGEGKWERSLSPILSQNSAFTRQGGFAPYKWKVVPKFLPGYVKLWNDEETVALKGLHPLALRESDEAERLKEAEAKLAAEQAEREEKEALFIGTSIPEVPRKNAERDTASPLPEHAQILGSNAETNELDQQSAPPYTSERRVSMAARKSAHEDKTNLKGPKLGMFTPRTTEPQQKVALSTEQHSRIIDDDDDPFPFKGTTEPSMDLKFLDDFLDADTKLNSVKEDVFEARPDLHPDLLFVEPKPSLKLSERHKTYTGAVREIERPLPKHYKRPHLGRTSRINGTFGSNGFSQSRDALIIDDDGVDEYATIEEMFELPQEWVPMISDGQLAYREGVKNASGRLGRPKATYKVGYNFEGRIRE
ncbi:hypothetical protein LTS18_004265 [Coniosporium uncinatum]|uniref:Uncharacterized protein n=1 Tax=Coniosporium uncinatum TaxID=93489 RepID=A0ACC3E072_9PEZI|nr:hypothetical protein LTS18_004265 [Coniosporium uncinatum]